MMAPARDDLDTATREYLGGVPVRSAAAGPAVVSGSAGAGRAAAAVLRHPVAAVAPVG